MHPTLTFRLIETLKGFGGGTNQLILFTHSADLLSTYYSTGNVFFIDSAPAQQSNQAHQLSTLANAHATVARAAGANLGLFAVGKRLIFVEGREASVDRLVYHKVAQSAFPDSYVMPIGSVDNLVALRSVVDELTNAIFGIDLFMVRDRDGLSDELIATLQSNARFRSLPRRHVENYLLDPDVLSDVGRAFYLGAEQRDSSRIREKLRDVASTSIMNAVLWNVRENLRSMGTVPLPAVRDIDKMTRDDLASSLAEQMARAVGDVTRELSADAIRKLVLKEHSRLAASLATDEWVRLLPGKLIFSRFCGEFFGAEKERTREAYVDIAVRTKPEVFDDIVQIFRSFAQLVNVGSTVAT